MSQFQIHLVGTGHSGRGVRYKTLDIDQLDQCEAAVAADVKPDMTVFAYNRLVAKEAVVLMVCALTEPVKPEDLPNARWTPCTPQMLEGDAIKTYFTTKDLRILREIHTREHEIGKAEVDSMLAGKVAIAD